MKQLKPIVRGGLCVAFFLFLPFWACKGQELDVSSPTYTGVIKPDYQDEVRLNYDYNSILDYQTYDQCLEKNNGLCVKSERAIQYLYITSAVVQFADNEDYFSITQNSRTFLEADGSRRIRIYGGQPFIKVEGQWYETGIERTSQATWDKAVSASLSQAKFDRLNPFKIYRLNAQTYYGTNDDCIIADGAAWNTAWGATTGSKGWVANEMLMGAFYEGTTYSIRRSFVQFDMSGLDLDGYCVEDAEIDLWVTTTGTAVDNHRGYCLTTGSQSDPLVADDFNNVGSSCVTDTILHDAITTSAYNAFGFLSTSTIAAETQYFSAREALQDVANSAPGAGGGKYDQISIQMSSYTGTTHDPYLEVTTVACGEEPPAEEEATTTIGLLYPENMCINNDLSIICGMTQHYESTTTLPDWVEYHYYHIPFLVWVIIAAVTLWLGNRLLLEFLIRWRQ